MGKRSTFRRIARDAYDTPVEAVTPLLPHLTPGTCFAEPCAGAGQLIDHLQAAGHRCVWASDIEPRRADVIAGNALELEPAARTAADVLITNPPWSRGFLHPFIAACIERWAIDAWLLFDADWMHTRQSARLMAWCTRIVSVGRIKWIPGSTMTGKDNCCWYLFSAERSKWGPAFYARPWPERPVP